MSAFERLHPAIQHHIVNSLGWQGLRPLQEGAIGPVLAGEHALLLAPTAGGKTEAAVFPVLSRMLQEDWRGLSVLYLCPIKALLNNLEIRLHYYAELTGRRAAVWHGDVTTGARNRIVREPPDILLTTPESVEVMLTSVRIDHSGLLEGLRCVIVDELHAFAGDDRGWHLLSVVERLTRVAKRDLQRLGLSATVGNPDELLGWFKGSSAGPARVVTPGVDLNAVARGSTDVVLDYVGNLDNAATVISRLHRGEKRLVFCDSRARVEQLAHQLRGLDVSTFVSHSSLSAGERQQAEAAFTTRRDAVIVATSTLELGIDVGDLDRVIQIDAPATVASFLQRLGRTGRRAETDRNCLFLATREGAFLQAAALLHLWVGGFVEPVLPPVLPYHILAQQLMALVLQEHGVGRHTWREWLGKLPTQMGVANSEDEIVQHMLDTHLLHDDSGILSFGEEGERTYGWRNFMELMTVFTGDPLIAVRYGREDLGYVHPLTFVGPPERVPVLLLAGRRWAVRYVDWSRKVAHVEPTELSGRSQWLGGSSGLHNRLCRAMRSVLAGAQPGGSLTDRGKVKLDDLRESYAWVREGETTVVGEKTGEQRWWTFAGLRANVALRAALGPLAEEVGRTDNLSVRLATRATAEQVRRMLAELDVPNAATLTPVDEDALKGLKFSECLPAVLAAHELQTRLADVSGLGVCAQEPVVGVRFDG